MFVLCGNVFEKPVKMQFKVMYFPAFFEITENKKALFKQIKLRQTSEVKP